MDSALITGMAAVLGSLAGASASIATTWMTQRNEKIRERAQSELRRRETLYGEFITEVSRLTGDAFGHSLERPETFANVYGLFGRMHLVAFRSRHESGGRMLPLPCRFVFNKHDAGTDLHHAARVVGTSTHCFRRRLPGGA